MRARPLYVSTSDAAMMLGISPRTVTRYIAAGHLDAGTLPGGDIRLSRAQVIALIKPLGRVVAP